MMSAHYLDDVETQVRRIDPDLDLNNLQFDLSISDDGTIHLGWCHDHIGVTTVRVAWKNMRDIPLCEGILNANTVSILSNCTDKELASAVEILLDLERFAHRDSEDIRADVNNLQDVVDTAFELARFEEEVWDMFAPAMSAIPKRYDDVLQPVASSISNRVDILAQETICHPDVQRYLIEYHTERTELDHTPVTVALGPLWLFRPRSEIDKQGDILYATVRSMIPEIRSRREVLTIPRWLYTILRDEVPVLVLSEPYDVIEPTVLSTATTLWSEEEEELYHAFDRCVEAAQLVNR
jgi:hypothetical protein